MKTRKGKYQNSRYILLLILIFFVGCTNMLYLRHSIKETGGDFDNLADCIAHIASSHASWATDYSLEIIIEGAWTGVDAGNVDLGDLGDNDADHPIWIHAAGESRHTGKWTSTGYVLDGDLTLANGFLKIEGLQVDGNIIIDPGDHVTRQTVASCLVKNGGIDATIEGVSHHFGEQFVFLYNNIIYDCTNGFNMTNWLLFMFVFNNTVYNCTTGFNVYGGAPTGGDNALVLFNNVARGCTDGYNDPDSDGFRSDSDYNSSDISGDAPCATMDNTASPWYSDATDDSSIFVDAGNDDFHIKAGCIFIGVGATMGDPVTQDIDDEYRGSAYDLGADQYVDTTVPLPWWWTA